ncbi:MAG: SCO6880 family protein [Acidimicrobiales bacterium]
MTTDDLPRYRFGPRSTRGLIAGWRGGQIAAVAIGAALALGLMRSVGGMGGATLALVSAGAGVALATWPVAGRPIESWTPTVARYVAASMAGGHTVPWSRRRSTRRGTLSRLQLRPPGPDEVRGFAIIEDEEASTFSGVLPVGGPGYALFDEPSRAAAIAAWSGVLTAMATESRFLHRLQWIARTYPSVVDGAGTSAAGAAVSGPGDAYRHFAAETNALLWNREVLVVVTTAAGRSKIANRASSVSGRPGADRLDVLLGSLSDRLAAAGLVAGSPLNDRELAAAVRRGYELAPAVAAAGWPWPIGVDSSWRALRTDATWQATYWVAEWPRGEVGPGVLLPLLIGGHQHRTVSLTMAPLPPVSAVRRAERERTSGAADAELRRRHGFALTARARAEQEVRLQREAELAEGHAAYLFSGYVNVTAGDEESLERSCGDVEQSAALAQLELRRLYGAQEEAWCCTLPIGRGCR